MNSVLQQGKFGRRRRIWLTAMLSMLLCAASANAARPASTAGVAGCRDGWHRVGTLKDPTLRRTWAVVASCEHPTWPAHLEPADQWQGLPVWVSAGSRVMVTSPESTTAMRLDGRTVTPGRVGQTVTVRLVDGVRVSAKLTSKSRAEMATVMRWRRQ